MQNIFWQISFPVCDESTENLIDLTSPRNEVVDSDFVIDDLGVTLTDGFPLLDMKGQILNRNTWKASEAQKVKQSPRRP